MCAIDSDQTDNFNTKFGLRSMKSLRQIFFCAGMVLLALSLLPLSARTPRQGSAAPKQTQNPQRPPQEPQQPLRVQVNQVVVPVTVKDGAGRLVPDLRKEDFRVLEDNVEQRIVYFSAETVPLSLVLLIDNDLKSKDARQVVDSLDAIVASLSTLDEAFVCRFDQFFHQGKGFTTDQDKLLTELKRTRLDEEPSVAPPSPPLNNGPTINGHASSGDAPKTPETTMILKGQSNKALDDAVYAAAQLLKDRDPERRRRKIILLISDGVNNPKFNTNDYDTTIKEVLRNEIAVYGVGVGSAVLNRRFERLAKYARDSGGDVYYGLKRKDMEELYSRVTEEARNQYTLAYTPTGTDRGAEHHSIEVRVKREGLTILTREGYYSGAIAR
jgi:Ca-activated chloride channel homolog